MNKTSIGIRLAAVMLALVTVDLAQAADPLEAYPVKGQVIQRLHAFDNPEGSIFSADGRYVAFNSLATNLVPGDTEDNDILDVFVRDLLTGATTIASLGAAGQHGGDSSAVSGSAFSSDDHMLAFSSFAPNFVPGDTNGTADAFLREFKAGNSSTRVEGKQQ